MKEEARGSKMEAPGFLCPDVRSGVPSFLLEPFSLESFGSHWGSHKRKGLKKSVNFRRLISFIGGSLLPKEVAILIKFKYVFWGRVG